MTRQFSTRIAGYYYYQGHDLSGLTVGQVLRLVREPSNIHDSNAVRVETADGVTLGHIPRAEATQLAREMDSSLTAYAAIISKHVGGQNGFRGRGRRKQHAALKPDPPTCYITVYVGDGAQVTAQHSSPPPVTQRSQPVQPKSSCFVATAVFRDADHPTVTELRRWRDTSLAHHLPGRMFIRAYALIGPRLAFIVSAIPSSRRWLVPVLAIVARTAARPPQPTDP